MTRREIVDWAAEICEDLEFSAARRWLEERTGRHAAGYLPLGCDEKLFLDECIGVPAVCLDPHVRVLVHCAALVEQPLKGCNGRVRAGGSEGFTEQQEARGVVGDGQRITVSAIAELELALEVGTPQIIGRRPLRQRRAARAMARPAAALDQAVAVEHRMDGAFGGNLDTGESPRQALSILARTPAGMPRLTLRM